MKPRTLVAVAIAGAALIYMSRRLSQPAGAPGVHGDDALFPKYPGEPSFYMNRSRFRRFANAPRGPVYC